MVIVMKHAAPQEIIEKIHNKMVELGCKVHKSQGENYCLLGLVGETSKIQESQLLANPYVDRVLRVQHPFKLASRLFHPEDTVIDIEGHKIGGKNKPCIMAGPCSVESEDQLLTIARAVKESGAQLLRGGAYKPRTSPYSFQGLGEEGLKLLLKAKEETGMPIVTEVMDTETFETVEKYADILQIGARNMQNFPLLKKAGRSNKVILLKRGLSATIEEFLMSAEYIMSEGNPNVILCERGIRTFETYTRNTLDISAIPIIQELSHLPIIVDPSHATGKWSTVEPLSKASIAIGAHGLIIEVHHEPELALSDGAQSLKPEKFNRLMNSITKISNMND
ncbi:3-deoxy-7-phosphoheptulonate synthase [Serpentinicella alkaliphila]|uniref:3-deoxy-D-arabinoheptulosonate-7-phosphate synthase n=1 Tax=Serpentinicella alkaliphila TaxID=1734049 RepID=A0A4R2TLQ3_9FIRM|nr:3-deoxy-7-phosphoheptulonate synthase [Serpentinicella alkaliphila]QUH24835.1 3-deoxy-7-phosphoheptulonate synthase [Serpentinicella alkaliphila]TCQ03457.1 3-deoxy-D-arabinoheptulosonate-7-phosphate synthase [Serpentinicella alkaliphila]